jgi:2-iminobutanoate/2-iminopropanoate deaminase
MYRTIIKTDEAPAAIGPYAQANAVGSLIFTSGQIPIDPETGAISADCIKEQTARVLENVSAILDAAGSCIKNVIKTTVFMNDLEEFAAMNEVYAKFFSGDNLPSRSTVQVARLPKDVKIEIEVIAFVNEV